MSDNEAIKLVEAVLAGEKPLSIDDNMDDLIDALADISAQGLVVLASLLEKANGAT